jgi:histidyl-tRNA synthetase
VFRNEKPGPGRFRQFMQFDADTVGSGSPAADAEICMMAADTMEALGIPRGSYVVKVNNRKVLDGVLEAIGLGGEENAGRRLTVLRAMDKADKFPLDEIRKLLGEGRKDESGDFTKGAGLNTAQVDIVIAHLRRTQAGVEHGTPVADAEGRPLSDMEVFSVGGRDFIVDNEATARALPSQVLETAAGSAGSNELAEIARYVEAAGYGSKRIRIDPSVVRGLEYYTGPVYEVELTFPVEGEDGRPVRFGSVAGGGRYDGLIGRFRSEDVPATGFSIGVSRLMAALTHLGKLDGTAEVLPLVVVTVMDKAEIATYQTMVASLRAAKDAAGKPLCRAELYLGESGFKAQMKYADRRGAAVAIIQGSDERARGEVQIKDLVLGAELAAGGKDRADYQDKQKQAQFAAPVSQLVEDVARVLTRQRG